MKENDLNWFIEALRDELSSLDNRDMKTQSDALHEIMRRIIYTLNYDDSESES